MRYLFLLVILLPSVLALQPNVTIIPQNFSANSSWILLVDPGTDKPVRINWWSAYGFGQVPRVGDLWMCYFSNDDPLANCGPNPFINACFPESPCRLYLHVYTADGENATLSLNLTVGNVKLIPRASQYEKEGKTYTQIRVTSIPELLDSLPFKLYNTKFQLVKEGQLNYSEEAMKYVADLELDPGKYYAVIEHPWTTRQKINYFGASLLKFTVGYEETARVSLEATPFSAMVLMTNLSSKSITKCCIRNLMNDTVSNLSVQVPKDFQQYLSVGLERTYLGPAGSFDDSMTYTVTLKGINQAMHLDLPVTILSGTEAVGTIPLDIWISVKAGAVQPTAPSAVSPTGLRVSPNKVSRECLEGEDIELSFWVENQGNSTLWVNISPSSYSFSIPEGFQLEPGNETQVLVNYTCSSPGLNQESLTFSTGVESISVPVIIQVWENLTGDVESLRLQLSSFLQDHPEYEQLVSDINSSLDSAISYQESGEYLTALEEYNQAKGQFDMLQSISVSAPAPSFEFDPTILLIPVVLIVLAVLGWFVLKWLKSRPKKPKLEKELEEEF